MQSRPCLFGCVHFVCPNRKEWNTKCSSVGFLLPGVYPTSPLSRLLQTTILYSVVAKVGSGTPQNPFDVYSSPNKNTSHKYLDQLWENENWDQVSSVEEKVEEETDFLSDEDLPQVLPSTWTEELQDIPVDEFLSTSRDTLEQVGTMAEEESLPWVITAMKSGEDRKAKDIVGLWVSELTTFTSFFVNMSGNNEPQIQAIARNVEGNMWNIHQQRVKRRTGTASSGWILLDYGDMIVNIMSTSLRKRYNLEGLWHKAEKFTIEKAQQLQTRNQSAV